VNNAFDGADHVAWVVCAVSLAFATATAIAMAALLLRRHRLEGQLKAREANIADASRAFMQALAGNASVFAPSNTTPDARRAALSNLLQLVRGDDRVRLLALGESEGLFAHSIEVLSHAAPARRIDAIRQLEQFGGTDCVAALATCVRADPDSTVRLEAAVALARFGKLPPVNQLIDALGLRDRPATRLHAALFRSLAVRDSTDIVRLAASAQLADLRPLLVEAIGWSEDLTAADVLARYAADLDPEVRCAAIRSARSLAHPSAGVWLVALLGDTSEAVRIQAAQACGQLRVADAVTALWRLATEPSWWVRLRAREALEQLAPDGPPLLKLIAPVQ
jgi:HEAT repeat protein